MPISTVAMRMKCDKNVESLVLFMACNGPLIMIGVFFFIKTFAELELCSYFVPIAHCWYVF